MDRHGRHMPPRQKSNRKTHAKTTTTKRANKRTMMMMDIIHCVRTRFPSYTLISPSSLDLIYDASLLHEVAETFTLLVVFNTITVKETDRRIARDSSYVYGAHEELSYIEL